MAGILVFPKPDDFEDVDENMKWGSIVEVTDTTVNPYKNEKQFRYSGKKIDSKVLGLLSGVGYIYLNGVEIDELQHPG